MASVREPTGRSVISFQSIFFGSSACRALGHGSRSRSVPDSVSASRSVARRESSIPDLEDGFRPDRRCCPDVDAMQPFDGDLVHLVGDRVIPSPAKRSTQVLDQEMRSGLLGAQNSS